MKRIIGGLTLALCLLHLHANAHTIYLTRHAEKAATGTDPALTAEGQARATNIAATLKDAQVKHVYSTAYQRTQQTAQPLATYLGLPVKSYDPTQLAAFAQQLRALPENTLVVGHSDTTPELIRQLGGDPGSAIAEAEFDRLYQLAFAADGSVTTTLLHSLPSTLNLPCASVTLNQASLAATAGNWLYFTINVPECANTLNVSMSGGTGDGDLYVRLGAQPTATDYSCRPYKTGNVESCSLSNPQAGTWHIGIKSYTSFSGITLNATAAQ